MLNISKTCWLIGIERVLLTLWVGGLWITGYLVVPTLFAVLDDRQVAGLLAGRIFQTMNYVGLGIGTYLLISVLMSAGKQKFNLILREWRVWSLVTMLLLIMVAAFIIQPMMQELKTQGLTEGSVQAAQFGRLHGVSSILFLINSVLGLLLVAIGLKRKATD
jgi:uncharacterized oligopeptide transporter (OPT) family protein